jgi:hypothetical protein
MRGSLHTGIKAAKEGSLNSPQTTDRSPRKLRINAQAFYTTLNKRLSHRGDRIKEPQIITDHERGGYRYRELVEGKMRRTTAGSNAADSMACGVCQLTIAYKAECHPHYS